jgi:hypothetical protein
LNPVDDHPWKPIGRARPARENLEARLLPLVRRALRNRIGLPALVGWVHRSLASLEGGPLADPDRTARGLTRLLCEMLLQQTGPGERPAAETMFGP